MTDQQLIIRGCVAEYDRVIYELCKIFRQDNYYSKSTIRNKPEAEKLITDLRCYAETLEEVTKIYHNLCPSPNQPSQTAASEDVT